MATRANPFYQPQTPIGEGFNSLAMLMLAAQQERQGQGQGRAGSVTPQGLAQADKYRAETEGINNKNQAMATSPTTLAEIILSGGRVTDDPMLPNPSYNPDQQIGLPANFDLTTPMPVTEYQPMFQPGRSAQDKMGMAIQEALIRGVPATDISKLFAQGAFLNNVNAGTPEAGMPYMPLFGSAPTTNTALTTGRQDTMSARDAAEAQAQAFGVARIQGQNSANVANINQAGQTARYNSRPPTGGAGGVKPGTVPTVTPAIGKAMKGTISSRLEGMGFKGVDDRVIDGLLVEASKRFQDPAQAGNFKSATAAVDSVLSDLNAGTLPGFESATQPGGFFSRDKKTLSRQAPSAPAPATPAAAKQDPLAAARDAIARGANREAVIKRLKDNGIDTKGL
jgi:hypothetical protein